MVSIKFLNIAFVLLCIFITSFMCTFLAISSSEKAMDDTKDNRDDSLASAFAVGEESVANRTKEYLDIVMKSTMDTIAQFTREPRVLATSLAREMESVPWDTVKRWKHHRLYRVFHQFDMAREQGTTVALYTLRNRLTVVYNEDFATVANGPDGPHWLDVAINHGEDRLADIYGIDWYVHLVIDREYILGTIDKKTAETRDRIKASEKQVDDDLKAARTVLYVLIVVVAVVLTVLSVVFVLKIIEPLVVLEAEMAAVAVMRLEEVDTERPLSALEEVRLMQVSFLQMMKNLVEYRNYMPASVLQTDDEDDISSECTPSRSHSRSSVGSQSARIARAQALMSSEVSTKRVTLMTCNVVGFLEVQNRSGLLSRYLASGLHHLKEQKGIPDSFSGDRLYASWNGVRGCASHRTCAYLCARALCDDEALGAQLSIGIASGQTLCGNMGCDGMKKFSYIGSLSSWVHVVERVGKTMESQVTIDAVVHEEVCNRGHTRMLQHVVYGKHSHKVVMLYEALAVKDVKEEEWMYQLEEGQEGDPYKAYNASYALFKGSDPSEALKELGDFDDGSSVAVQYRERLHAAVNDMKHCLPLGRELPVLF